METQVKKSIAAEPATSTFPSVIVEQILAPRNKPDFQGVLVRWITQRGGSSAGILGFALGGSIDEQRVAIQTFHKDVIKNNGIKPGINLNEILKAAGQPPVRLTVKEVTETDYQSMSEDDKRGFSAKVNPSTGEYLTHNGEQIYRNVSMTTINTPDVYLQSDSSDGEASSDEDAPRA